MAQNSKRLFYITIFVGFCSKIQQRHFCHFFLISDNFKMGLINKGSVLFSLSCMSKLLKNPGIGTRDGNCGCKMGQSKQLPNVTQWQKVLFWTVFFWWITNPFELELHSKLLFHKAITISRYMTNSATHAKSHSPRILNQKWHVTQWR